LAKIQDLCVFAFLHWNDTHTLFRNVRITSIGTNISEQSFEMMSQTFDKYLTHSITGSIHDNA